jgi:ATPase subunit of ABC transporter with duplicated ATPase domains
LNKGMRVGLVGANGCGKSTLLKILAGLETADAGRATLAPSTAVGYLPQFIPDLSCRTVEELLLQSTGQLKMLEARIKQLEAAISTSGGNQANNLMQEYGEILYQFQAGGGYEIDHKIKAVSGGLGIGYLERWRRWK